MKLPEILRRNVGKILAALLVIGLAIAYFYGHREDFTRAHLVAYGKGLSVGWFLCAFLILPLIGFPISILLVLAGVRFGFGWGMSVAAVGVFTHNAAAFFLTHGWFREKLRKRLASAGHKIPDIPPNRQVWYTMLFAAIHGPPYALKLYLLALTDVPFRIYFWAGAPVYLFFCMVPVGAGSAVMTFDPTWAYILITALAALTFGGHWLKKKYAPQSDDGSR